jgi:hypothetical protein
MGFELVILLIQCLAMNCVHGISQSLNNFLILGNIIVLIQRLHHCYPQRLVSVSYNV